MAFEFVRPQSLPPHGLAVHVYSWSLMAAVRMEMENVTHRAFVVDGSIIVPVSPHIRRYGNPIHAALD